MKLTIEDVRKKLNELEAIKLAIEAETGMKSTYETVEPYSAPTGLMIEIVVDGISIEIYDAKRFYLFRSQQYAYSVAEVAQIVRSAACST